MIIHKFKNGAFALFQIDKGTLRGFLQEKNIPQICTGPFEMEN